MPWTRKLDVVELARLLLEDADELLADDLALRLGLGRRRRAASRKRSSASTGPAGRSKWSRKALDDLLGLVLAHQAVVDEDAGELVADRPVDEQRGDRASRRRRRGRR